MSQLTETRRFDIATFQALSVGTIVTAVPPGGTVETSGQQFIVQNKDENGRIYKVLVPVQAVSLSSVPAEPTEDSNHSSEQHETSFEISVPAETEKQKKSRLLGLRRVW